MALFSPTASAPVDISPTCGLPKVAPRHLNILALSSSDMGDGVRSNAALSQTAESDLGASSVIPAPTAGHIPTRLGGLRGTPQAQ